MRLRADPHRSQITPAQPFHAAQYGRQQQLPSHTSAHHCIAQHGRGALREGRLAPPCQAGMASLDIIKRHLAFPTLGTGLARTTVGRRRAGKAVSLLDTFLNRRTYLTEQPHPCMSGLSARCCLVGCLYSFPLAPCLVSFRVSLQHPLVSSL